MRKTKGIGIGTNQPSNSCEDPNCPYHGSLKLRGRIFNGVVVSAKRRRTASVEWQRLFFLPKYERYEKRRTKLHVHIPDCLADQVKEGSRVKIMECRPLSKTKNFVIVEVENESS